MMLRATVALLLPMLTVSRVLGVGILHRHGDREVLVKDSSGFVESTYGTLTDKGYTRMEWLGTILRERYLLSTDTFLNTTDFPVLHNQVSAVSSSVDRTVASANAVIGKLFQIGDTVRVPVVYSIDESIDIKIRSYKQCDNFKKAVEARRLDPAFRELETTSQKLRTEVADLLGVKDNGLEDVWNLYDELQAYLAHSEDETDPVKRAKLLGHKPELSNLLNWISDYDYESAKTVPTACQLLTDINTFIAGVIDNKSGVRLSLWSGHYPTLISLAKLLGFDNKINGVPGFGAAIVFEIVEEVGGGRNIHWYYIDEGDNWDPLNSTATWGDVYVSSPSEFVHLQCTVEQWCDQCSDSVPICLRTMLFTTHTTINEDCNKFKTVGTIVGAVIGGIIFGYGISFLTSRNRQKQHEEREMKTDLEMEDET